jgi:hypothetical protein
VTGAALLDMVGGVRAAVFAGLAALLLVGVGVQTWRLHSAETREAKLTAAAATYRAAQATNLSTIDALRQRLADLAAARALERRQQADALARAETRAHELQRALAARTLALEALYATDPDAARWGAAAVPHGVLRQLPGGADADR